MFNTTINVNKYITYILQGKTRELVSELENIKWTSHYDKQVVYALLYIKYLMQGDVKEGLRRLFLFHNNRYRWPVDKRHIAMGEKPNKLVVVSSGGIGDDFVNMRYLMRLANEGIEVSWFSPHKDRNDFLDVLEHNGYKVCYEYKDSAIPFCFSDEVPIYFNVPIKTGRYIQYISEEPPRYIRNNNKIKIGIRWRGNPNAPYDEMRTLDLDRLYTSLSDIPNIELYSLQRDAGAKDVLKYPDIVPLHSMGALNTLQDTIDIINSLDIIVTSDTSIAHIAGALDKPTIVFVPFTLYYVWISNNNHSYWYSDNIELLRQTEVGKWDNEYKKLPSIINKKLRLL